MADFTVASQVKTPDIDPLATVGKLQGVQQGMLQNRLLGLNLQGKQALGSIIGQNTDPDTGETDWQKVSGDASQDPNAAIMLPEIQQQVLARQLTQVQLQREQLGLTGEQWNKVGAASMELLARKDPKTGQPAQLNADDVMKTISQDAQYADLLKDPNFVKRLAALSQDMQGKDPDAIRSTLKGLAIMSSPTAERIGLVNGPVDNISTGSQIVTRQVSPLSGEATTDAVTNNTRSPESKASMVQVWNPQTHQYEYKPSGAVVGDMAPGAVPGQPGTGATPPATVAAAPALGETATAEDNVQQAQALQRRAAIVPQRKAALSNLVATLDQFTTGPQASRIGALKGLASQFGLAPDSVNASKAAQDEFNKLAAQIALDQWGSLGGSGSNEQLATAFHANPNEAMSKLGIKNVAALLQGNEDAIAVQAQAWQKYSAVHGPASYGEFLAGWNRYYDPRVFQADHMDAGAKRAMLGKMTPEERKTFDRDSRVLHAMSSLGQ